MKWVVGLLVLAAVLWLLFAYRMHGLPAKGPAQPMNAAGESLLAPLSPAATEKSPEKSR